MPLNFVYTMVQKSQKMSKNSNQGGPALRQVSRTPLTLDIIADFFQTGGHAE